MKRFFAVFLAFCLLFALLPSASAAINGSFELREGFSLASVRCELEDGSYTLVRWASAAGVTSGTSATTFSPDAACTRAQIVAFLYRDRTMQ